MDVLDIICMGHCENCDFDMAQCLLQGYCEYDKEDDDEKLIKQIRYLADRYGTANCIGNVSKNFFTDTLDLIHRLQDENADLREKRMDAEFAIDKWMEENEKQKAEIERLTEELEIEKHNHKATKWHFDNSYKEGLRLLEANKELVKEADKLRDMKFTQEHCDLYKENEWLKQCLQQAVKDTAKEVYTQMLEWLPICGDYTAFVNNIETWLKERYGVEVE